MLERDRVPRLTVPATGELNLSDAPSLRTMSAWCFLSITLRQPGPAGSNRIIAHYTTANKVGPVRTMLPEHVYVYLLEHPVMAAALVNRLDLGLYQAELRGPDEFWATDGEGREGIVHALYQDRNTRIYYLEGTHDGRFLPRVSGKALVLFKLHR